MTNCASICFHPGITPSQIGLLYQLVLLYNEEATKYEYKVLLPRDMYDDLQECIMFDVTSCLSCLSSLSRLVSFRMSSSITITEKANTLLTVTTRIVRLIISGTLGYFGTNHFSNPNTSKTAQQKVQFLSNFSHIKSQVESTSSAIRSTIIEMSLKTQFLEEARFRTKHRCATRKSV